jgi:hypothetical protein
MIPLSTICMVVQGPFPLASWEFGRHLLGRTVTTVSLEQSSFGIVGQRCYAVKIPDQPVILVATPCLIPLAPPSTDSVERGTERMPEGVPA